jgi:DNA-binding NarL/FixJ family response regulator
MTGNHPVWDIRGRMNQHLYVCATDQPGIKSENGIPRTKMGTLRIMIADDHDLVRRGLKMLLEAHPGWKVCAEAHSGREAVEMAEEIRPDIAIMDISMPELNGIEAARKIKKISPNTEMLILSMHHTDQLVREIIETGAKGYIIKSDSDRSLVAAVEALAVHKPFFTSCATEIMLESIRAKGSVSEVAQSVRDRLTPREREIVQLLSEGKSSKEVAVILGISVKTSETHRANIMRKLEIHSVSQLVRYAVRNQIVEA